MLLVLLSLCIAADAPPSLDLAGAHVVVGSGATDTEVFAAREMARYLRLLSGQTSAVAKGDEPTPAGVAVYVGTPASGIPMTEGVDDYGAEDYLIRILPERRAVVISGKTPIGVQNGVYALVERLGVGFYLGGDALPEQREAVPVPIGADIHGTPAFRIRGSLPWYNFLNSPTTWDLEDFQYFFDQMAKMRYNFVGFHSYDSEPFCAYPLDTQWYDAAPAATSLTYGWGTIRGMKCDEFGFGTGRYFFDEVFGSRSVTGAKASGAGDLSKATAWPDVTRRTRDQDAVLRAQCGLAQGLDYARRRGLHVCVGYELQGDPTNPETRRHAEARIRNTLATYPMADYIWFWQQEGAGGGLAVPALGTPLRLLSDEYAPSFKYLDKPERVYEAARVAAYVQFAYDVVRRVKPDIGIVVSGWGGDAWMKFSDFYIGLDALVRKDIVFAALDNIDPSAQEHVSHAYGELSPGRERWPIPWWQSDGGGTRRDQWGPQTNVKPYTALLRDALAKKCEGVLSIHWEIRGVEEVAAYMAQFAWNPTLSYEDFYTGFAERCFGAEHAAEMAQILMDLEALGPRWTGGPGQVECGGFSWFSDERRPNEEHLAKLRAIRERLEAIRASFEQGSARAHLERLNYLIATTDWLTNFDRAALALTSGGEADRALAAAESARQQGNEDLARSECARAVGILRDCGLREAMQAFTTRLTTQGDWGNLATINIKAYAMYEKTLARVEKLLGAIPGELTSAPVPDGPVLKMRTPPTALPEGAPFVVRAVALDSNGIRSVRVLCRKPGETTLQEIPAKRAWGDSYAATLPAKFVDGGGVEFSVEAESLDGKRASLPIGPANAVFTAATLPASGPRVYGPWVHGSMAFKQALQGEALTLLRGVAISDIEYDALNTRLSFAGMDNLPGVLSVYDQSFFRLAGMPGGLEVTGTFTVADGLGRKSVGDTLPLKLTADSPPDAPRELKVEIADAFLARITWDASQGAAEYEIHRSEQAGFTPDAATLLARWPWRLYVDAGVKPNVTYHYAVIAVNDGEKKSAPCYAAPLSVADFPLPAAPANVKAAAGLGRVTLQWDPVGQNCAGYSVFREQDGAWNVVSGAKPIAETAYVVGGLNDAREYSFRVVAVDRAGRSGEPSAEAAATPIAPPHEPVFAIAFDSPTAETGQTGTLQEGASIREGALDLRAGGWMSFPNEERLQLSGPVTAALWANLDRIEGMPVLLSFGHFEGPGYWIQLFSGSIRWYIGKQRILDAGQFPTGAWHHLAATYDGQTSRLYVDGKLVGQADVGQPDLAPWPGELRIGQYADIGAPYQTRGMIDDVQVYQRALPESEVAALAQKNRTGG